MPISAKLDEAWSHLYAAGKYEDDQGFSDVIQRISAKGMTAAGLLGVFGALTNVTLQLAAGYRLGFVYGVPQTVVIWDKLGILCAGLAFLALAKSGIGIRWGRSLGAVIGLLTCLIIILDDYGQEAADVASNYLSLVMFVLVVVIPYRPLQAAGVVVTTWIACFLISWILVVWYGAAFVLTANLFVFMVVVLLLCTGVSALLYSSRYEQYRAQRKAEILGAQVAEQAEELRKTEHLKARFFANVSHEFRTPLSLILGPVEDALRGAYGTLGETLQKQLGLMRRSGHRLQHLIDQLLDLSKLEAGHMHLHVRRHDLNSFLNYIVSSFKFLAERKNIALESDSGDRDHFVYFDADRFEQVVSNLISNAIKFTPENGRVYVGIQDAADDSENSAARYVEIYVRDTGPGIAPTNLESVFDRFRQVDNGTAPLHVGTGIGLALARELVEAHGGSIRAESDLGFGSTFLVRLRLGADHFEAHDLVPGALKAAAVADRGSRTAAGQELDDYDADVDLTDVTDVEPRDGPASDAPLILIVEDHADMREYLRRLLSSYYRVEEAADGAAGLAIVKTRPPDLVIADVMMPLLDGFALCRAIKTNERLDHIPVILLTAKAERDAELEGLELGADDYITKPFHAGALLARVENLIELRRKLQEHYRGEIVLEPTGVTVSSTDAQFLERVRVAVEEHMANGNFGVEWLADEVGVSSRHLQRKLRALTRLSANGYINMMRLKRAAQLLEQHAGNVAEIAYTVGYHDAGYFSRLFKQTFGVTPSTFVTSGIRQVGQTS